MEGLKCYVTLQDEMLGSVKGAGGADWCILIMDTVTTRVMSRAARISEILDYGVSCRTSLPAVCSLLYILLACISQQRAWSL